MKFSTLSKAGFAASVCAALAGGAAGVQAGTLQDTIFGKVEPSIHDRMFVRLHYVSANIKTTAKDAYDVTGPVLGVNDIDNVLANISRSIADDATAGTDLSGNPQGPDYASQLIGGVVNDAMGLYFSYCKSVPPAGLGTPCGVRAKGQDRVGTVAMSVGYFLSDEKSWVLEALLLGKPVSASVYGDGRNHLNGKKIISTKLLPPILSIGYYFGEKSSAFRPYLGLAAAYAIFFDVKAEKALNDYQGGGGGDNTTAVIKNSAGLGGFVGFKYEPKDSPWNFGLNIGKIRFKTEATLTTRNTVITSNSEVLMDYGPAASSKLLLGNKVYAGNLTVNADNVPLGYEAGQSIPMIDAMMCDLARARSGRNDCNLGTFVRKAETVLDNTMFMLSVGHTF